MRVRGCVGGSGFRPAAWRESTSEDDVLQDSVHLQLKGGQDEPLTQAAGRGGGSRGYRGLSGAMGVLCLGWCFLQVCLYEKCGKSHCAS